MSLSSREPGFKDDFKKNLKFKLKFNKILKIKFKFLPKIISNYFYFGSWSVCEISSEFIEKWLFYKDFRFFHLLSYRVRCTINRSHSTPCKMAEFEHLQIFPGHCLDFFLSVSGKICHSPIKKVKRQPTLIISFSQHSPFFWEQSKNPGWNPTRVRRYLGSAPGSLWQNSPHKDAFFCISLTNIDQCWITCTFKVE